MRSKTVQICTLISLSSVNLLGSSSGIMACVLKNFGVVAAINCLNYHMTLVTKGAPQWEGGVGGEVNSPAGLIASQAEERKTTASQERGENAKPARIKIANNSSNQVSSYSHCRVVNRFAIRIKSYTKEVFTTNLKMSCSELDTKLEIRKWIMFFSLIKMILNKPSLTSFSVRRVGYPQ